MYDPIFGAMGGYNPTFAKSPDMSQFQPLLRSFDSNIKRAIPSAPQGIPGPAMPNDGAMQPTIGPGTASPPPGGIMGLLQGQSPQGLLGMLQRGMPNASGAPLAGGMPQAGMLPGMPRSPMAGPVAPPAVPPQLPTDINPMNQF